MFEINQSEEQKDKKKTKTKKDREESLQDLWDTIKRKNIHIVGIPEGEEKEKGTK